MKQDAIVALEAGTGFADLSSWRKIGVSGGDALSWLNDLVSADLDGLAPGRARRSLLLSPTGSIRAEFTVALPDLSVILLQDPGQPRSILDLLAPYVLSSDVELEDRTGDLALVAFPGRAQPPDVAGATPSAPSCLGDGVDLLAPSEDRDRLIADLAKAFAPASTDDVEAWRVRHGIPRFGQDALDDDLPQEGGFQEAVSFGKGCFLGQEAVAKVRNLGHPRRLVVRLESDAPLERGIEVFADGAAVGTITSASGTAGLAKIQWRAREGPFRTANRKELRVK
jgi:folate-binding protein YgfZ